MEWDGLECAIRKGRRIASTHASNCITAKRPQFPAKTAFRGEGALVHIPTDHALAALSDTKDAQFRPFLSSTHAPVRVQRRRFPVPITIPASQPGRPPTCLPGGPLLLGHPLPVIEGITTRYPQTWRGPIACTQKSGQRGRVVPAKGRCSRVACSRSRPAAGSLGSGMPTLRSDTGQFEVHFFGGGAAFGPFYVTLSDRPGSNGPRKPWRRPSQRGLDLGTLIPPRFEGTHGRPSGFSLRADFSNPTQSARRKSTGRDADRWRTPRGEVVSTDKRSS